MCAIIRDGSDPQEWTPQCTTNGASWSGKHVSELAALDLVAILEFCKNEGSRVGPNDAAPGQTDVGASNPFHADLLGGYPYREWASHYIRGISEFTISTLQRGGQ